MRNISTRCKISYARWHKHKHTDIGQTFTSSSWLVSLQKCTSRWSILLSNYWGLFSNH